MGWYAIKPNQTKSNHIYLIYLITLVGYLMPNPLYTYKEDLALNNLQGLICHRTKPNLDLYQVNAITHIHTHTHPKMKCEGVIAFRFIIIMYKILVGAYILSEGFL